MDPAACRCAAPGLDGLRGLVDPASELLLEIDAAGAIIGGYPHTSPMIDVPVCRAPTLAALLPPLRAALLHDRLLVLEATGEPSTIELALPCGPTTARIARAGANYHILLRRSVVRAVDSLAAFTARDDSFWQLFEAAPIPLAVEIAVDANGVAASRLNRKFTEVFGYTVDDIPTVQHWWPLAYPDERYRAQIRDEWFRRVRDAVATQTAITPMDSVVTCKDGSLRDIQFSASAIGDRHVVVFNDLTDRLRAERELNARIAELREALAQVKVLTGLLPLCAWCKKLRDDSGYWQQVEDFIRSRTEATVTHGICPDCHARVLGVSPQR